MRPIYLDLDPANASLVGYQDGATGAGPATLAATSAGDGLAHQISIQEKSSQDKSGITFTITGTDPDGKAQTEAVTGPEADQTVESAKYFLTVSSITWSATLGAHEVDIGWVDEFATRTIPLDYYRTYAPSVSCDLTGTANFDVEVTYSDVFASGTAQADYTWINDATIANKSADITSKLGTWPCKAMRVVCNSYTDTAELAVTIFTTY